MASLRTLRGLRRGPLPPFAPSLRASPSLSLASSSTTTNSALTSSTTSALSKRSFSISALASLPIDTLSTLILSSPVSYGATILALTVAVRSAVSLPAALWTRARTRRYRETVVPLMKAENDRLALQVFLECKAQGVGREEYMKVLKKRVADAQYALHKKYGTHPVFTLAVPFLTNIPILIVTSLAIRNAIAAPDTALVGQSLLWLKDITLPDPTGAIGMLAGCMAFASSEIHTARRRTLENASKDAAPDLPVEAVAMEDKADGAPSSSAAGSQPPPTAAAPKVAPKLPPHLRPFSTSAAPRAAPPRRRPGKRVPPATSAVPQQLPSSSSPSSPSPSSSGTTSSTAASRKNTVHGIVRMVDGKRTVVPLSTMLESEDTAPGGAAGAKQAAGAFQRGLERVGKVWSIGIIGMSLFQPAALVAYWVCSIGYTMVQNLIFARIDEKYDRELRARRLAAKQAAAQGAQGGVQGGQQQVVVQAAAASAAANPPTI